MQAPAKQQAPASLTNSLRLPHTPALKCVSTGPSMCSTLAPGLSVHAKLGRADTRVLRKSKVLHTTLNCTTDPQLSWQCCTTWSVVTSSCSPQQTHQIRLTPHQHVTTTACPLSVANTGRYTPACQPQVPHKSPGAGGANPKNAHAQHGGLVATHCVAQPAHCSQLNQPSKLDLNSHIFKGGSLAPLHAQRWQPSSCSERRRHQACRCSWQPRGPRCSR